MILGILRVVLCIGIALLAGKLVAKVKMPAILGWLITGMVLGPHALGLLNDSTLGSLWFTTTNHLCEMTIGLMIGTELVWKELKKSGGQILTMTLTESFGTFLAVTATFALVFSFSDIPFYVAPIMGAISLATAPAPSLSIVSEYKADGPVTRTLIPLAVLDDVVGMVVFFSVIGIVASLFSGAHVPVYVIPIILVAPIIMGAILGFLASFLLRRKMPKWGIIAATCFCIVAAAALGIFCNEVLLPKPVLNLMLMGVSMFTVIANRLEKEQLELLSAAMGPIVGIAMVIMILNLAAPLDYHLIMGAGLFTFLYIVSRMIGKTGGASIGAVMSHAPSTVRKYLGLTLLPHSGVSLLFTGIAVNLVSKFDPGNALVIQSTIAAAAVINEIIAVFLARLGFQKAGELGKGAEKEAT